MYYLLTLTTEAQGGNLPTGTRNTLLCCYHSLAHLDLFILREIYSAGINTTLDLHSPCNQTVRGIQNDVIIM